MSQYNLGHVVGAAGANGNDGADANNIWVTTSSPNIVAGAVHWNTNNFSGKTGATVRVGDLLFYNSSYAVIIGVQGTDAVTSSSIISIKGDTGNAGATGKGISSITKTSTSGLVDTYTITYSDNTTSTFDITNGQNGTNGTNGEEGSLFWTMKHNTSPTIQGNYYRFAISDLTEQTGKTVKVGDIIVYDGILCPIIIATGDTYAVATISNCMDLKATVTVVDDLTSDSSTSVLSAKQGKLLDTNKVNTSDIANNLTTAASGKVLDARQGKALADMIGSAITYINQ